MRKIGEPEVVDKTPQRKRVTAGPPSPGSTSSEVDSLVRRILESTDSTGAQVANAEEALLDEDRGPDQGISHAPGPVPTSGSIGVQTNLMGMKASDAAELAGYIIRNKEFRQALNITGPVYPESVHDPTMQGTDDRSDGLYGRKIRDIKSKRKLNQLLAHHLAKPLLPDIKHLGVIDPNTGRPWAYNNRVMNRGTRKSNRQLLDTDLWI